MIPTALVIPSLVIILILAQGDVPDQDVTTSTVAGINAGDTVDSRYYYEVTGSDGSSGRVYFIASNGANNYGDLMAANFQLTPGVTYTFGAFNREGAVQYDDLVPAKALLSDHKVVRKIGGLVTYFHILFDQHEIIFAEGCPSESFQPSGKNIAGFDADTYDEIIELFPELAIDSQLPNYSAARYSLKYKEGVLFA